MTALALAGVLPTIAGSPVVLGAALLLVGVAAGATDVAINAAGVHAELRSRQPVMNLAHACFSLCSIGLSSAAPAVFASAAAAGRFAGNVLARRVGRPIRLLCAGALMASGGTLVAA